MRNLKQSYAWVIIIQMSVLYGLKKPFCYQLLENTNTKYKLINGFKVKEWSLNSRSTISQNYLNILIYNLFI